MTVVIKNILNYCRIADNRHKQVIRLKILLSKGLRLKRSQKQINEMRRQTQSQVAEAQRQISTDLLFRPCRISDRWFSLSFFPVFFDLSLTQY